MSKALTVRKKKTPGSRALAKLAEPDPMLLATMKRLGITPHQDKKKLPGETKVSWRCRSWGIPMPTFQPIDDLCVVWRLPPLQLSAGGIITPEDQQSPHVKGILLAHGPRAADTLVSNGVELGDIVIFGRFAGWEPQDATPEYQRHNKILILKARDINGSDDLAAAMREGTARYEQGEDGRHRVVVKRLVSVGSRRAKVLEMAKRGSTEAERKTAKSIAERMDDR